MKTTIKQLNDEDLDLIKNLGYLVSLSAEGNNDIEGHQIFTSEFIVNDMLKMIGREYILDFSKTILEPTSGDGAFTVRILEIRLNSLSSNDANFMQKSLQALSSIYSIEMDREMLILQRSNIYTTLLNFAKKYSIELSSDYHKLAKQIIVTNIIWGEVNIKGVYSSDNVLGWYLPLPLIKDKKYKNLPNYHKAIPLKFAKWVIKSDLSFSYTFEDAEFDNSVIESELGGIFNE